MRWAKSRNYVFFIKCIVGPQTNGLVSFQNPTLCTGRPASNRANLTINTERFQGIHTANFYSSKNCHIDRQDFAFILVSVGTLSNSLDRCILLNIITVGLLHFQHIYFRMPSETRKSFRLAGTRYTVHLGKGLCHFLQFWDKCRKALTKSY